MEDVNIIVLIITHNDVNEIDKTLSSVNAQDFPSKNIWKYIVDFNSTDGTYEKILRYQREHTAVFQIPDVYNKKARESRAFELVQTQTPPNVFSHFVSLKPGDILYPPCFSTCAELLKEYRVQGIPLMVCEADIIDDIGRIKAQPKISDTELLISPQYAANLLLGSFCGHYVGFLGGGIAQEYHSYECNERCFWEKTFYSITTPQKFIYTPKVLLCLKERTYPDEVDELLSRWVKILTALHRISSRTGEQIILDHAAINRNLANYALWRLSMRYAELTVKEREDFLYLAEIIDPEISQIKVYQDFQKKLEDGLEITYSDFESYLHKEFEKGQQLIQAAIDSGVITAVEAL